MASVNTGRYSSVGKKLKEKDNAKYKLHKRKYNLSYWGVKIIINVVERDVTECLKN